MVFLLHKYPLNDFFFFFDELFFLLIERANYMIYECVNHQVEKIALVRELHSLMEESIITDIIAWLRTNQIRVIFQILNFNSSNFLHEQFHF